MPDRGALNEGVRSLAALAAILLLAGGVAACANPNHSRGIECRVSRVLDGDSLRLECDGENLEVRLHCIDAPEKDQRPWANRSRAHLRDITNTRVELIPIEQDRFGRTVADLYTADASRRFINLEQVTSGNAAVYERYCEDPRFPRAQAEARAASRGIWSQAGLHQTPWIFRHRHR